MFKKFLTILIFLISLSSAQAFECISFESKTVSTSVDDLFCVYNENKLTPLQMDGQYTMSVELDKLATKQADENIYNHKIIFGTKGVLLLKAPNNEIMTVEVIDPAEKEALTEMVFALGAQKLSLEEKDIKIAELTLEKGEVTKDYLLTKAELETAQRNIAENQTIHDQLKIDADDLDVLFVKAQKSIDSWRSRFYSILGALIMFILFLGRDWMNANSQMGPPK
ncbi:MAG: hypothetical protein V3U02_12440 [Calditrichia bacterium]